MAIPKPFTFSSSSLIISAQVNDNFDTLFDPSTGNLGLENYDAQHSISGVHTTITCQTLAASLGVVVTAGGIVVNGDSTVTGSLTISADVTAQNAQFTGNVVVTGNVTVTGNTSLSGTVTVSASSNFSTGKFSGQVTFSSIISQPSMGTGVVTGSAGDICLSNSCGVWSATSSLTTVTNLSVTLTTTGRPVFIGLVGDNTTSNQFVRLTTVSGTAVVNYLFYRGATPISNTQIVAVTTMQFSPAVLNFIDIVAAGTYTYSLQGIVATINDLSSIQYCKLVAFEL